MKLILKLSILATLAILILVALGSIKNLTRERKQRLLSVKQNIAASYAGEQVIVGPVIRLNIREFWNERSFIKEENQWGQKEVNEIRTVSVFPSDLEFTSSLRVEERYRGIFKANVFLSSGGMQGAFTLPDPDTLRTKPNSRLEWVSATAGVHVKDPRGISSPPSFTWNGQKDQVLPGSQFSNLPEGFHIVLSKEDGAFQQTVPFEIHLDLHGMQRFQVVPIASQNQVHLTSPWPHPSFIGDFLATTREIGEDGFSASWNVNGLATSAQQRFDTHGHSGLQTMGVDLIDPVNPYPMTDRALKYSFLFVFLTFAAFLLFELLRNLHIHPIQYGFVGIAQAVFFLLLLSLSEHIPFGTAYLLATAGCTGIITFYLTGVLANTWQSFGFGGFLGLLYVTLFGLLQSEDHALVAGSVLLFGLLSSVMLFTRNVNWYTIGEKKAKASDGPAISFDPTS